MTGTMTTTRHVLLQKSTTSVVKAAWTRLDSGQKIFLDKITPHKMYGKHTLGR